MLAAAHRLRRGSEFAAAVRGGRRAGRGAVVVHLDLAGPTPSVTDPTTASAKPVRTEAEQGSEPVRAGFVVSRSVGGAVLRNQVRRRLRHLVGERLATLPPGATIVVRALPDSAAASYERLGADLDAAIAAARSPRRSARRSR